MRARRLQTAVVALAFGAAALAGCGGGEATSGAEATDTDADSRTAARESAFPEGVYRVDLPREFLLERGVDAEAAFGQAGISTLTFEDGRWVHRVQGEANPPDCSGPYTVEGDRISVVVEGPDSGGCGSGVEIFNARWSLEGDELRFLDVRSSVDSPVFAQTVWGGKPWKKID